MQSLINFLKNKRIIIIGPSGSAISDCKFINFDDYDLIVRINHHFLLNKKEDMKYLGQRTDIVYHVIGSLSTSGDSNLFTKNDINYYKNQKTKIITRYPHSIRKLPTDSEGIEFYEIDDDYSFVEELKEKIGCNPNTGVVAIFHLLTFDIKELTVIGFDFYQSLYQHKIDEEYRKRMVAGEIGKEKNKNNINHFHEPDIQLEYIKNNIYNIDKRFIPLGMFKQLLEGK